MTKDIMQRIALRTVELLNDQLRQGIDSDGKRYSYSTKPFVRPLGRLRNYKQLAKRGEISLFTAKRSGNLWIYVKGGYRAYRAMTGRDPDGDFLTYSGRMLQAMGGRALNDKNAQVFLADPQAARQVFWLNFSGAGKSRKVWKFFNLTKENEEKLAKEAAGMITTESLNNIIS